MPRWFRGPWWAWPWPQWFLYRLRLRLAWEHLPPERQAAYSETWRQWGAAGITAVEASQALTQVTAPRAREDRKDPQRMPEQKSTDAQPPQEMYFATNWRVSGVGAVATEVDEFEVTTDVHVVGELVFGPYFFTIWDFGLRNKGQARSLCLRVNEIPSDDGKWTGEQPTTTPLYHGGGIESEITALASVFLRCRLTLGPIVRHGDRPMRLPTKLVDWIDPEVVSGQRNLADLGRWLELTANLKPELHQGFILAAKLYQQGLEVIETKPDLAYLNLVSAIEVLSQDFPVQKSLKDADGKLARLLQQIPDPSLRQQIEDRLLEKHLKFITERFVQFIQQYVDNSFWLRETSEEGLQGIPWPANQITPERLPGLLRQVYDQRSRTLHAGKPFPPTIFAPPFQQQGAEFIDTIYSRGRQWTAEELVPYPQFFERLVRHVLINYVRKEDHQRTSSAIAQAIQQGDTE